MHAFDEIGEAMILAQQGREQLARMIVASLREFGARIGAALRKAPAEIELDRPSRSF
jgi:hypothetical protein